MTTDAIYNEIRELKKDLESMSPKVSSYQKSLKRYQELQAIVGGQGETPSKKPNKKWERPHHW